MLIPIFWEINNAGEPVYKDIFLQIYNDIKVQGGHIVVSPEYAECMEKIDSNIATIIPADIMSDIDAKLSDKKDREKLLAVLRDERIENIIDGVIQQCSEVRGIVTWGRYGVVEAVARDNKINVFISSITFDNNKEFVENIFERLKKYEDENTALKKEIDSKNEYIQQLQVRVNNAEGEIYRNKKKQETYRSETENIEKRLEKSDEDKMLYLNLYKELLSELDRTKIELLNLKMK